MECKRGMTIDVSVGVRKKTKGKVLNDVTNKLVSRPMKLKPNLAWPKVARVRKWRKLTWTEEEKSRVDGMAGSLGWSTQCLTSKLGRWISGLPHQGHLTHPLSALI